MKPKRSKAPLNYSARWKYIVLAVTVITMLLSALPSVYGEREALHVSNRNGTLNAVDLSLYLSQAGVETHSITQQDDSFVVAFASPGQQENARQILSQHIDNQHTIALALEAAAPDWLGNLGFSPIKLGLDLRGGVQFLLEVDVASVYQSHAQALLDELRQDNRRLSGRANNGELILSFQNDADLRETRTQIRQHFSQWSITQDDSQLRLVLSTEEQASILSLAVQQNLQTMRGRIEELGITEAIVQRQGENRIRIELPGVQDPAAAKDIIGATASLAFHALHNQNSARSLVVKDQHGNPINLVRKPILGGEHIIDARANIGEMGSAEVNITLDAAGGRLMTNFSRSNIGNPMATVFSEYSRGQNGQSQKASEVISIATIQSQLGNRFRITGAGSLHEAQELALLLRAGSLTAPVTIIEERTIGPTLGAENVKSGFAALALGLSLTLVFIACWYRRLGWIANLALLINMVCLFGLIALLPGAVLTLPGIAGLVLTVGMAVDTNVLIFERIRDKLKQGRNLAQAIDSGFASAFSSIFDANLTTMIVAIALYSIGNGPIQGFALTLGLGLLTSLFTGVFTSRLLINHFWGKNTSREEKI
ncbi:protein translocase subunit SecD [Alginatibacterium sediminis]|uniref:Protein translocase subunit SecD n=1 Tax=Alginatibacterium sediminis TaxID=2164068 RepID=A0A420E7G1_9ALTE|nr:protein translocase subunit SecD [Alginatibacterium sediminis]RKF13662.1 protein translocase subunit SecD [Alginatibacterium sediminis]